MIMQVELGFGNGVVDDIFYASGYDIRGYVVAQVINGNLSILFSKSFIFWQPMGRIMILRSYCLSNLD